MKKTLLFIALSISTIISVAQQTPTISAKESDAILYMREEEKLARDVYEFLYAKYNVNPFGNIRFSEQTHMDRMKTLISNYNLVDPVEKNGDQPGVL
ncbi:MAG: DUF2202 domain-containing protein [Chitinophagaceae bacterium]|nr:DUF2202 domain-containing protein [Chitinophagaceae bacterium]